MKGRRGGKSFVTANEKAWKIRHFPSSPGIRRGRLLFVSERNLRAQDTWPQEKPEQREQVVTNEDGGTSYLVLPASGPLIGPTCSLCSRTLSSRFLRGLSGRAQNSARRRASQPGEIPRGGARIRRVVHRRDFRATLTNGHLW